MLAMLTALLTYFSGPWGVAVIALAVFLCFIFAGAQILPPRAGIVAFACGAAAWLGAFVVRTYLGTGF